MENTLPPSSLCKETKTITLPLGKEKEKKLISLTAN